ncbi:tetratricopeptide repeat-containing sulfotransferase family protein [Sphingomonas sp.]|uniref:tetratricopeptide repeat-containing sulfotransferase family protein n=1 Tax=Sphingomonas sp. TaxID=28214 RepID=UPI0025F30295|nr:tetratricopeptide repeat-containing sulfotransferase family protein [Sphingomonas sp.]
MNVATDSALREAAGLARQGRFAEACAIGARALGQHDDPVLHALVGALHLQLGQFADAVPHLEPAIAAQPGDNIVRGNLVEALIRVGREREALDHCDEAHAAVDPSLRLRRLRAHLTQAAGDMLAAVDSYSRIIATDPGDWASLNNLGNALSSLGRFEEATEVLARAARLVPDSPPIQLNYANALLDAGRFDECEAQLRAAAAAFPHDPYPLTDLFAFYKRLGHEEESIQALRAAVALDPGSAPLASDLGQECAWRNLYDEAEASFERALTIDPTLSPSYVGLASVYERTNRESQLQPLQQRAVAAGADAETGHFIHALILKRANKFEEALAELDQVGEAVIAARRFNLRGQLLERLGRSEEAFEAFAEMNRQWAEDPSQPRERAALYRDEVAHAEQLMTPAWVASWSKPVLPALDRPTPAFLVGFPRSGTTLLDTLLMGHGDMQVLEEEPFLGEAERDLGGPDALASLTADEIGAARDRYFEKIAGLIDLRPDSLIIDKHPLHLNKVPVIRRLFPDAKIILALRHPCDVLLSCFITNFRLNNAMVNFLDLDDAARLYDLTFRFFDRATAVLHPPVHTVVYERMVEDPRRELEPLVAFLGLEWRDALLNHRSTAIARGPVSTASYAQVTEPIYRRAAGRWTRYRRHLKPIFPVIRPWVEKFGYSLDEEAAAT